LGILVASEQIEKRLLNKFEVIGELSLNGDLRPVNGVLTATLAAIAEQKNILLPMDNAEEAGLSGAGNIYCAANLLQVCRGLAEKELLNYTEKTGGEGVIEQVTNIAEIRGNEHAKRALLIAAAAGHNILMLCYYTSTRAKQGKGCCV